MRRIGLLLLLIVVATAAFGQELIFFDGDVRIYERVNGQLFELQDSQDGFVDFGYQLDLDYVVRTFDGFAEILLPNGHILKLADNTEVQLESVVAQGSGSGTDVVSVASGRLRSVVANLTGTGRGFEVRTPTAVGGVRGTDFVTQVTGGNEIIAVKEGLVNFTNNAGDTLSLAANQFADALAASFAAAQGDVAAQFYGALDQLSEQVQAAQEEILAQLPPPPEDEETPETEDDSESSDEEETDEESEDPEEVSVEPVTPSASADDAEDDGSTEPAGTGPVDEFMANLAEALGLEIGSISLEGQTYAKLIAQPTFSVGKLRAGLYLPIVYSGNLFDIDDWYRPKGNNEWSFGTDQDWRNDTLDAIADLTGDIALKIKFLEWGDIRDDFFIKVGNLSGLQLGHGLLMRDYANDTEFPAVRRIGLNLGYDFGRFGFEALTNDLAAPEIFGTRVYFRPFGGFPLAVGVSGVADIGPARDLPTVDDEDNTVFVTERELDPIFLNLALDLDLPIIERDALTLVLFGDVGGLLPYLRNDGAGLSAGLQIDALTYENDGRTELRNYGVAAGVFGNAAIMNFRLEFQNYHGIFQPAFYNANYDRVRGEKARETIAYLLAPDAAAFQNQTIGIYGEAGFSIADAVRFDLGYLWPWTRDPDNDDIVVGDNDFLLAGLTFQDGLLPLGITAGFSYQRTFFAPTLLNRDGFESARLFDEYTVLSGEIVYPVAPIMDIVASVSSTVVRDTDGSIVYEERGGQLRPKYGPVISIETRIGGIGE